MASLKLVVIVLTMLSVCVAVDVGVVMEGAVEQGSVGGTIIGGATCIIIREQYCLPLPLCSPIYVLTNIVGLELKHVHY